jgi:mono/diheme cytochrome c family protein
MKKITKPILAFSMSLIVFSACQKEEEPAPVAKITYDKDIKAIFVTNCTPCHLAGGANPNKWDNYMTAQSSISKILDRVQREPGSQGFMPRNATAKISAENIALLKQWVTDGLLEK